MRYYKIYGNTTGNPCIKVYIPSIDKYIITVIEPKEVQILQCIHELHYEMMLRDKQKRIVSDAIDKYDEVFVDCFAQMNKTPEDEQLIEQIQKQYSEELRKIADTSKEVLKELEFDDVFYLLN